MGKYKSSNILLIIVIFTLLGVFIMLIIPGNPIAIGGFTVLKEKSHPQKKDSINVDTKTKEIRTTSEPCLTDKKYQGFELSECKKFISNKSEYKVEIYDKYIDTIGSHRAKIKFYINNKPLRVDSFDNYISFSNNDLGIIPTSSMLNVDLNGDNKKEIVLFEHFPGSSGDISPIVYQLDEKFSLLTYLGYGFEFYDINNDGLYEFIGYNCYAFPFACSACNNFPLIYSYDKRKRTWLRDNNKIYLKYYEKYREETSCYSVKGAIDIILGNFAKGRRIIAKNYGVNKDTIFYRSNSKSVNRILYIKKSPYTILIEFLKKHNLFDTTKTEYDPKMGPQKAKSQYVHGANLYKNKKIDDAYYWFKKSATQGNTQALFMLGLIYQYGTNTIHKNHKLAFSYYKESAEGGDRTAQNTLGNLYYYGIGSKVNKELAFFWYKKAAENGEMEAQLELGLMYYNGIGTLTDKRKAAYWIKKSYNNGWKYAKEFWDKLELWKY